MEQQPLINAREVAQRLNITAWTVYDYARRGILPSIRMAPNCIRFDPQDVKTFIEEKRFPPSR
jgi:excisionase family DNA binding protein